jgi:hypothetical protein
MMADVDRLEVLHEYRCLGKRAKLLVFSAH